MDLADGDITKFDNINKLPIYLCLNTLSFKKDIREAEKEMLNKAKRR